jgi:predicted DNA-binding transcriptional regulator YafY
MAYNSGNNGGNRRYNNDRNDRGNRSYNNGGDETFSRKQLHYSPTLLSAISNAIENTRMVSMEYDSREKGMSLRDAEPMAMVFKNGKRHLVAWCKLREDYRSFRLDRISTLKVNKSEFIKRTDFDLAKIESQMEAENASYQDEDEDDFEEPEM